MNAGGQIATNGTKFTEKPKIVVVDIASSATLAKIIFGSPILMMLFFFIQIAAIRLVYLVFVVVML